MIDEEIYNKYKLNHYDKVVMSEDGDFYIERATDADQSKKVEYLYKLLKEWLSEGK